MYKHFYQHGSCLYCGKPIETVPGAYPWRGGWVIPKGRDNEVCAAQEAWHREAENNARAMAEGRGEGMMETRNKRLMPGGVPRWIRCYDDGGESADRYTVVYTRLRGYYLYILMSGSPFHPQGVAVHGEGNTGPIDRPTYGHLGNRIKFSDLPPDCQKLIIREYKELWGMKGGD